jgi:hypothetical protein
MVKKYNVKILLSFLIKRMPWITIQFVTFIEHDDVTTNLNYNKAENVLMKLRIMNS